MGFEPSRTRTCDPLVKSQLLYQLSYRPIYMRRARKGVLFSIARKVRNAFYRTLIQYSNVLRIRVSLRHE